jgi:NADH:ubiquinone oxidoreductase subunit 2 (subunit N)
MMIVVGGLWAAFQRNLGKMLAYAVLASTGYAILAVSLPDGLELHFGLVIPRMVSFGVWALALSILRPHLPDLDFRSVQGIARQFPLSGLGIVLAHLGLAGFPLLANFPVYFLIWQRLSLVSEVMSVWVVIGEIGLFLGALRTLAVFVMGPEQLPWNQRESRSTQFFLAFGLLLQLIFGLFPHWFYPLMATLTGGITAHLP